MTIEHLTMEAVRFDLPHTAAATIRAYASDKHDPHPTAQLMKELNFEYKAEENKYGWGRSHLPRPPHLGRSPNLGPGV